MEKILLDEKYEQLLFQIPLLRDLPHNIKQSLLEKLEYSVYSIDKKDIVARQGTPCKKLYILLEGKLRVDIIDGLGNKVMVEYIVAPRQLLPPLKTVSYSLRPKNPPSNLSARIPKCYTTSFA